MPLQKGTPKVAGSGRKRESPVVLAVRVAQQASVRAVREKDAPMVSALAELLNALTPQYLAQKDRQAADQPDMAALNFQASPCLD